jgi:hypothetical protein
MEAKELANLRIQQQKAMIKKIEEEKKEQKMREEHNSQVKD